MISISRLHPQRFAVEVEEEAARCASLLPPQKHLELVIQFAKTGELPNRAAMAKHLALLAVGVLRRPFNLGPVELQSLQPSSPLAVVLLAAHARLIILEQKPVNVLELSALAGLDESFVRKLIRSGEIESTRLAARSGGHQISARVARAWLAMREVPGFVAAKGKKRIRHVTPGGKEI